MITVLDYPENSPNANPIENSCRIFKMRLRNYYSSNLEELTSSHC